MRNADRSVMFQPPGEWAALDLAARVAVMGAALDAVPPGRMLVYFLGLHLRQSMGLGRVAALVAADRGAVLVSWRAGRLDLEGRFAYALQPRGNRAVAGGGLRRRLPLARGSVAVDGKDAAPVAAVLDADWRASGAPLHCPPEAEAALLADLNNARQKSPALCAAVQILLRSAAPVTGPNLADRAGQAIGRVKPFAQGWAHVRLRRAADVFGRHGFRIEARRCRGSRGGGYRLIFEGGAA